MLRKTSVEVGATTHVLFMHGLESHAGGTKARYLQANFAQVRCPDMKMSLFSLKKENSPARWCVPYVAFSAALATHAAGSLTEAAVVLGFAAAGFVPLVRWCIRASLAACVDTQAKAISDARPDIVVASSWGGAVALRCLETGIWDGPTVLLAPAVAVTSAWLQPFWPTLRPAVPSDVAARCVVVQGGADEVVDARAVAAMCERNAIPCELIAGEDHRLNKALLDSGRLAPLVARVATAGGGEGGGVCRVR